MTSRSSENSGTPPGKKELDVEDKNIETYVDDEWEHEKVETGFFKDYTIL
jgi:hypothetical protein